MRYTLIIANFIICTLTFGSDLRNIKDNHLWININSDQTKYFDLTKVLPKGYVTDGSVDYTRFIQKGINQNSNIKFPNFPILINDSGLDLNSNSKVLFMENSKLILKPSAKGKYEMVRIHNKNNIEIKNLRLEGDRKSHIGKGGEWGVGLSIYSSSNINIFSPEIKDCWGDGITISKFPNGAVPAGVNIYDAKIYSCRRNGVSLGSGKSIKLIRPNISNISGAAPGAGIDIEPANQDYRLDDIFIESPKTAGSVYGILLALERASGKRSLPINIDINNHVDYNSTIGFRIAKFRPIYKQNLALNGRINIKNPKWDNNKKINLLVEDSHNLLPHIYFEGTGFNVGKFNSKRVFHK